MKEQLGTPEQEISEALTVHIASGARTSHSPEMIILMSSGRGFMELKQTNKKKKKAGKLSRKSLHRSNLSSSLTYFPLLGGKLYKTPLLPYLTSDITCWGKGHGI